MLTHLCGGKRLRYAVAALTTPALLLAGLGLAAAPGQAASPPAGLRGAPAATGHIAAGHTVTLPSRARPFAPTAAQLKARQHAVKVLGNLPKPPVGPHTQLAGATAETGPATQVTRPNLTPGTFDVFKTAPISGACADAGCAQSVVNEPDTAQAGKVVEQSSNWNMAYTTNIAASPVTWSFQDPYTLTGSNPFCCDATFTYVPSRNRFVYAPLTLGSGPQTGFDLALSKQGSPTSWCVYHFSGASFGGTDGNILDYPKVAYDDSDLYVTFNEYNAAGNSWLDTTLARMPLDPLAGCSGFGFSYLKRTDNFTFGLTMGGSALNQAYWVSNWYTQSAGSGTSERIYWWPDNSSSYFWKDIGVASYNFTGGENCGSQDGVVTNWCTRLDPRWETASIVRAEYNAQANSAFAGDSILAVTVEVGPTSTDPFPAVGYEYFRLNALTYVQTSYTFNPSIAFAYAGCAPDTHGYLGCSMSWGGGTESTHYFPGGIIVQQDAFSPTQPWGYSFNYWGSGNASAWGDYQVTQPVQPDVGPWVTSEWAVNSSGVVVPEVVVFGRGEDNNGYVTLH